MVASEAAPFVKTGGLADVVGSLPAALKERGEDVAVALPLYRDAKIEGARRVAEGIPVWLGLRNYPVHIRSVVERGVPFYFVECPPMFDRDGIYFDAAGDFPDNHLRFAVLSRAALGVARYLFRPQILHCHDWQASLVPVYLRTVLSGDPVLLGARTLLTIHNLGYSGIFPMAALPEIGLDSSASTVAGVESHGNINLLKAGIISSDAINTVSRGYAREIQTAEYGFGLDGLLRARQNPLTGILNGVDYTQWNPETDPHIASHYSAGALSGKQACKLDLLRRFGLPSEAAIRPLIGIVSRFADQKGFDLIAEVSGELAAERLSLVVLGSGDERYEKLFRGLAEAHPEKIAVHVAYDDALAHQIEAGADIFLMPSRYEPCGLNQIYSLRYGTVPVVRATGGLDDTIDEETGFKFTEYSGEALLEAVRAALAAYRNRELWIALMRNGMRKDYSWSASAAEYSALYRRLLA